MATNNMSAQHTPGPWQREFTAEQIDAAIEKAMAHGWANAPLHFKRGHRGREAGKQHPDANGDALRLEWYAGWVRSADLAAAHRDRSRAAIAKVTKT